MYNKFAKYLDFDWIAAVSTAFLLAFGLIAIYSLSLSGQQDHVSNFEKQLVFLFVGMAFYIVFSSIDYRVWKSYSGVFYLLGIILLVLVLVFGRNIRGTSGWFSLGFFNLQPVELMKLFLILSLARYFSRQGSSNIQPTKILVSFLYVLLPVFLAAWQPDMGAAMVMLVIWFGMLFLAGIKKKYLLALIVIGVVVPLFSWNLVLKDYQKTRINTFINPQRDPLGSGYNVIQSMVAVGSGGLWGKGLGHGSQSRLNFLPEKHTDFIFATVAEESGLVGSLLVLLLFGTLLFRLKVAASKARDSFGRLIVGGVIILFFFQIFVNIGMNLGVMPVAGLSLPLLSYGGSFLIIILTALGISQNVWKKRLKRTMLFLEDN